MEMPPSLPQTNRGGLAAASKSDKAQTCKEGKQKTKNKGRPFDITQCPRQFLQSFRSAMQYKGSHQPFIPYFAGFASRVFDLS
jgi:hypothetical protein